MKQVLVILLAVLLAGCSIKTGKVLRTELPEGATIETAQEIIKIIVADDFGGKIFRRFTNLEPSKHETYLEGEILPNGKGVGTYIKFGINYSGTLSNVDEILMYGGSIVREAIKNYFKNKT